eukprot:Colp12_sorted_trinity150504_noHs@150
MDLLDIVICMGLAIWVFFFSPLRRSRPFSVHSISRTPSFFGRVLHPRKENCTICFEPSDNILLSFECKHKPNICKDCAEQFLDSKKELLEISCPTLDCGVRLTIDDIKRNATKAAFERHDFVLLRATLLNDPNYRDCPYADCGKGQIHEGILQEQPKVLCLYCQQFYCFKHNVPWHEGKTCKQYDKEYAKLNDASASYLRKNTKKCPQCTSPIEKNHGCDHMTCSRCKHEFCWLCLTSWAEVRRDGNRHADECARIAARLAAERQAAARATRRWFRWFGW